MFNDNYGWPLLGDWNFSTQMTRGHWINGNVCTNRMGICHVYASLPSNTSNSVFINIHTGPGIDKVQVSYVPAANFNMTPSQFIVTQATQFTLNGLEAAGERNIYSVLLNNLTSSTLYTIQIKASITNSTSNIPIKSYNYSTLPSKQDLINNPSRSINLVVGGDVGIIYSKIKIKPPTN